MKITTVGLYSTKNVFRVHDVDEGGKVVVRKTLRRRQMIPFFSKLEPCLIGMEACGTVARLLDEEPEFRVRDVMTLPFRDVAVWGRFLDGLRSAGAPYWQRFLCSLRPGGCALAGLRQS